MFFLYTSVLLITLSCLAYYYFTRTFEYWQSRNIPCPKPLPFFGNYKDFVLRKSNAATVHKQIYKDYPNEKVVGVYRMTRRSLLIRDLDVIQNILIKDFECFEDRGTEFSTDCLGANLFHADSKIWRALRNLFSPLFTTGKLKNMIPLINERGDIFIEHIRKIAEIQKDQEIYSLFKKFTSSSFLSCAFGIDVNSDSGPLKEKINEIDYYTFSRKITEELDLLHPGLLKQLNFSLINKEVNLFFLELIKNIIRARNGVPSNRNDFIDFVLKLKNQGDILKTNKLEKANSVNSCVKLTDEVIAAQAFILYIGAFETNAATMTFMMYELAMNPVIQEKLIAEVDEVLRRYNGNITYEVINELPFMEKVFNETLRKYPVADLIRRAKENYNIPGSDITIEKDITILVPLLGISHDEKYYPDPNKFDPERFSPENTINRHPCAYIPFGTGPRHCIGKLFAKIQSRICLVKFLSNFYVEASTNTPTSIMLDPNRISNSPKGGIHLLLRRRVAQ